MFTGVGVGVTALGLIGVIVYLACSCRRDGSRLAVATTSASGAAFMGAPVRWQRDRFLNNI